MQESKFNSFYRTLMEDMTDASVFGGTQMSQFSGDTYAPGDTRIPKILGAGKGKKKKKMTVIRRRFPTGL